MTIWRCRWRWALQRQVEAAPPRVLGGAAARLGGAAPGRRGLAGVARCRRRQRRLPGWRQCLQSRMRSTLIGLRFCSGFGQPAPSACPRWTQPGPACWAGVAGGRPLRSAGSYSRSRPCQGRPSGVATRSASLTLDPPAPLEAFAATGDGRCPVRPPRCPWPSPGPYGSSSPVLTTHLRCESVYPLPMVVIRRRWFRALDCYPECRRCEPGSLSRGGAPGSF